MSENGAALESRVERLEGAMEELSHRVERMEGSREVGAGSPEERSLPSPLPAPSSPLPAPSSPLPAEDASLFSLAGTSILILAGAYVIRALTEKGVLPHVGGVIAGVIYAAVWIFIADRAARRGRSRVALFHAVTASAIAFPLVWETTVRFKFVSPAFGATVAALMGLVLVGVAWRDRQQSIAWIGGIGSIAAALSIATPLALIPPLLAGSLVGAATLFVAMDCKWVFVSWPAAILTNTLAVMAIGWPLLQGQLTNPGKLVIALVVFAVVWLGAIVHRRVGYAESPSIFDICESALLVFIGFGGAAFVSMMHHTGEVLLGVFLLLIAAAAGVMALTGFSNATAAFRIWAGALGGFAAGLATLLLLRDVSNTALTWTLFGLVVAEVACRRKSLALAVQSVTWIVLAALAGGVALSLINTLFSTTVAAIDFRPSAVAIAAGAAIVIARLEERFARGTMLAITAIGAFFLVVYAAAHLIHPAEQMGLALIRTCALAAVAASLALIARFGWAVGAIGLARAVLVIGGLKLLVEDVRIGSALMLVAAFAAYGGAMLVVGRCALRHTRIERAIQVTEPGEQTMQSAN
ncbi:MAG TPA: hypothetical protein VF381_16665 [Thermoanaerobaculia bacterium]